MPETVLLIGFIAASLVVLLIPGPGVLYVVARSATQGTGAGMISVLGLSTGALVHVAAATVGLSAVLVASATAFTIVKLLGAAYLIWLGISMILSRSASGSPALTTAPSHRRLFTDGVVISALNPKIAVFFLAYLPQFIDPAAGDSAHQILLLGCIYVALSLVTDGGYALVAGQLGHWLRRQVTERRLPRLLTGGVYIGLGIQAALAERPR